MAIQFVIIHNGTGYDVSNMFEEITWSGRKGAAPRSVSITLMDDDGYNHSRVISDKIMEDETFTITTQMKQRLKQLFFNDDFIDSINGSTNDKSKILKRIKIVKGVLK